MSYSLPKYFLVELANDASIFESVKEDALKSISDLKKSARQLSFEVKEENDTKVRNYYIAQTEESDEEEEEEEES